MFPKVDHGMDIIWELARKRDAQVPPRYEQGHLLVTHGNAVSWGREGGMMAKKGGLGAVSRAMKQAWEGME